MAEGELPISVAEAAQLLGISLGVAYELARSKQLPAVRVGRRLIVPSAALMRLLDTSLCMAEGGTTNETVGHSASSRCTKPALWNQIITTQPLHVQS